ncbi:MAG: hypothetical protein H7138_26880 [Myxococcales bacterium]|nr:hypothetical protein [Myxococcales bacterium]
MKRIILLSFVTLGTSLLGCSDSNTKPTPEQYDDTAQAIASQTSTSGGGGDVASMSDSVNIALGNMPLGFALTANGEYRGSRLGVDFSYAINCKNLAGVSLGICDATTNEASVDVNWSGELDSPNLDASVSRDGSWKVTGLQTNTATFTGDGQFSFDATVRSIFRPGVSASYEFDASASYEAVKITTNDRKVVDGSASFDLHARAMTTGTNNDVDAEFDVAADLTFHADHTATLVLDGSLNYSLNLDTGVVVRVNN